MKDYIAAVCLNGHTRNGMLTDTAYDDMYCSDCGALIITCCTRCNLPIKGFSGNTVFANGVPSPPAYCPGCGQPYQWTERKLAQASELISQMDELECDLRESLAASLSDLVVDTPSTDLAVVRLKRILSKVSKPTGELLKSILSTLICDSVKSLLGW